MPDHRQVQPPGVSFYVDEMLAVAISRLYQVGVKTWFSCQELEPGVMWIMFDDARDVERLLGVAAAVAREAGDEGLLARITGERKSGLRPNSVGWWRAGADIPDAAFVQARPDGSWPCAFPFTCPRQTCGRWRQRRWISASGLQRDVSLGVPKIACRLGPSRQSRRSVPNLSRGRFTHSTGEIAELR